MDNMTECIWIQLGLTNINSQVSPELTKLWGLRTWSSRLLSLTKTSDINWKFGVVIKTILNFNDLLEKLTELTES